MLSLQSSRPYPITDGCLGNALAEEGGGMPGLHLRPPHETNRTRFYTNGLHGKSDSASDMASMAAIFLSTSPDLASSLIHQYFRSEGVSENIRHNLSAHKTVSKPKADNSLGEDNDPPLKAAQAEKQESSVETTNGVSKRKSLLRSETLTTQDPPSKKTVKFSDDHGLPLVTVQEFERFDYFESLREELFERSMPDLKLMAIHDPQSPSSSPSSSSIVKPPTPPHSHKQGPAPPKYVCDFPIPSSNYALFTDKVKKNKVSLENILVSDNRVAGTVRVRNYVFEKSVYVRYTTDHWRTSPEVRCKYVDHGPDRTDACTDGTDASTDTFTFDLTVPSPIQPDQQIQFCVRFEAQNEHHWDNNEGENYSIVTAEFVRLRNRVREDEEKNNFRFAI